MTRVELNRKLVLLERERDELREINTRLRDKLLELAGECSNCDGTGLQKTFLTIRGRTVERQEPCEDCADIREVLG